MQQRVFSGSPYEPIAGFCRAMRSGQRIEIAGTAPIEDDGSNAAPGDAAGQARRCFTIACRALEELGGHRADVIRTRLFLVNASDFEQVARVHGEFFAGHPPVATAVVVAGLLDPEWLVEIELEAEVQVHLRRLTAEDRAWINNDSQRLFGASVVVSRGRAHQVGELEGFVAFKGSERLGLATFVVEQGQCELVTLDAFEKHQGVGTLLLQAVRDAAQAQSCQRLWLLTTNDNLDALRFYQRRGMHISAVYPGAVREVSRKLKPSIPLIGSYGIAISDELVLEMSLE